MFVRMHKYEIFNWMYASVLSGHKIDELLNFINECVSILNTIDEKCMCMYSSSPSPQTKICFDGNINTRGSRFEFNDDVLQWL